MATVPGQRSLHFAQGLAVLLVSAVALTASAQGPTTAAPRFPLPVCLDKQLVAAVKEAAQADAALEKFLASSNALIAEGKTAQISPRDVETAYGELLRIQRIADLLDAWGELAAKDLKQRVEVFRGRLSEVAEQRAAEPALQKRLPSRFKQVESELQRALRDMNTVTKLVEKNQPEQAQKQFLRLTDPAELGSIWYGRKTTPPRPVAFNRLDNYRSLSFNAVRKSRRAEAQQACAKALAATKPDYDRLTAEANQIVSSISAAGGGELGQQLSGPGSVGTLGERWLSARAAALKARGLAAYSRSLGGPDPTAELTAADAQANQKVAAALAGIIAADAKRASPEEAPGLYRDYLARLAPLLLLADDPGLKSTLEQPLSALAARSPELAAEVEAYRAATDELLRWRQRSVAAAIAARQKNFPPVEQTARQAAGTLKDNLGPILRDEKGNLVGRFSAIVPTMIERLSKTMLNKPVTVSDLMSPAAGKTLIGDYRRPLRCYVRSVPGLADVAATAVAGDLLTGNGQVPLTLAAAMALEGTRRGDLAAAGGPIALLGLAAWNEHFATLNAAPPRGTVRLQPPANEPVFPNELVVRVLVEPRWVAGDYYFVDVPPVPADGG